MHLSGHHILQERSTLPYVCHYPTDLVLDDVVADIVLVVKDLLISNASNIHHILHERSTLPDVCHYPTDLVLDDDVADTVLVVKDLLMSTSIQYSSHLA